MRNVLSRRAVLRGALGGATVTVALPRLGAMLNGNGTAYAAGGALPKRFGLWCWSNGVHLAQWVPKATGATWDLPEQMLPLGPHRAYVSVVTGMETKHGVGKGHCNTHTNLLTGMAVKGAGDGPMGGTAAGPSIDQIIAKEVGTGTTFRSVELGVDNGFPWERNSASLYFSHTAPYTPNKPMFNTRKVFDYLFAMTPKSPGTTAPSTLNATAALRKRVVDAVREDAAALSKKLGAADRVRLAQHLEGVDALERRIQGLGSATCVAPAAPPEMENVTYPDRGEVGGLWINLEPSSQKIHDIMTRLLATALACDLTRVFTYQYSPPGTRAHYPSLGVTSTYHGLTHNEPMRNGVQPKCSEMVKFYMRELAVFLDVFRNTPDGTGTLLDSCAILGTSDVAEGLTHSPSDYPMLVIGKGGGTLRGGIHHRSTTRQPATMVPLTLARAMGLNMTSFGVGPQMVTDSVTSIVT